MDFVEDLTMRLRAIEEASERNPRPTDPLKAAAREAMAIAGRYYGESAKSEIRRNHSFRQKMGDGQ